MDSENDCKLFLDNEDGEHLEFELFESPNHGHKTKRQRCRVISNFLKSKGFDYKEVKKMMVVEMFCNYGLIQDENDFIFFERLYYFLRVNKLNQMKKRTPELSKLIDSLMIGIEMLPYQFKEENLFPCNLTK